jgi:hypothetical protein
VLFTSRAALAGAVVLGSVLTLGVPAAAAPTIHDWVSVAAATTVAQPDPDERSAVLVSIAAPREVDRGETAALGVTVREVDSGAPVAGSLVILLRRASGESGWAEADRTVTDTAGRAVLHAAVKPPTTDFRARVPGTADHRKGRSAQVTVGVSP